MGSKVGRAVPCTPLIKARRARSDAPYPQARSFNCVVPGCACAVDTREDLSVRFDAMADDTAVAVGANRRQRVNCALEAIEGVTFPTHDHFKDLVIIVLANFACRHTKFVRARRYRRRCLISPTRKFSGMYRKIAPVTDNVVSRSTASRCLGLFVVRTRGPFWKPPYPSSRHGYCYVRHWIVLPRRFWEQLKSPEERTDWARATLLSQRVAPLSICFC
jgi:hypothetical protein